MIDQNRELLEKKIIGSLLLTTVNFSDCKCLPSHFTDFDRVCMFRSLRDYARLGVIKAFEPGDDTLFKFVRSLRDKGNKTRPEILVQKMTEMVDVAEDFRLLGELSERLVAIAAETGA